MKKVIVLIVLLSITFVLLAPVTITAAAEDFDTYLAFEDFVTSNSNRTVATQYETDAANYLANMLSIMGYGDVNDLIEPFDFLMSEVLFYTVVGEAEKSSQNVVAYKRSGADNAKLLVLGAHYGNLASYSTATTSVVGGEGAMDNGTGVASLLKVANWLTGATLPYDVAIVFFGAEWLGNYGAINFLENNEQPLLGMINIIGVGGGDYLYTYYDEVKRTHGSYLDTLIRDNNIDIKPAPSNKNYFLGGDEFPYMHMGLFSSNSAFIKEGVPSVNIFGYNWDGISASESSNKPNLSGTGQDTLEGFINLYGEDKIRARLDTVSMFIITALSDDNFAIKFETAANDNRHTFLYSETLRRVIKWLMIAGFVVAMVILYIRANNITKNAPPVEPQIVVEDDVFGLNSEDRKAKEDKPDDIFDEF